MISKLRYFFQKRNPEVGNQRVLHEQRQRFNPLRGFEPDRLVNAIDSFRVGSIDPLSRIIEELEERDEMMMSCARKNRASLGRCPHRVLIVEGYEGEERAELHRKVLTRFWANIQVSSAFNRNERGGIRLLKQQMAAAISRRYAVHEIVWHPLPNGEITAKFIQVPNWFFENRTGELRFLKSPGMLDGVPMAAGEWLITVGDGIGIAAAVLAMSKTLSRNDWLLFSERCGQPGLHVATDAAEGSGPWERLVSAVRNFGRDWSLVTDGATKLSPITLNTGSELPYEPLIDMCNKGIATLYRGADLSTISGADTIGASVQGKETDLLEQDACEMLSETLNSQIEQYVIRYVTGDPIPLAYLSIAPTEQPNVDQDIKIDTHLVAHGVQLSRNDALARYGRSPYDPANAQDDAPLAPPQPTQSPVFGTPGYHNQRNPVANPLQNAQERCKDLFHALSLLNSTPPPGGSTSPYGDTLESLLSALQADLAPVATKVAALLTLPPAERAAAADALAAELPQLIPHDPEMVAVLEGALADAYVDELANENPNRDTGGQYAPDGTGDQTGSGYTDKHQQQVGKDGNWKELGLPAGRDIPPDPPTPKTGIAQARERLLKGENAKSPLGDTLAFDEVTREHLYKEKGRKPRNPAEVNQRLQSLDQARAAIENPHEIWHDKSNGRNIYVRFEQQARGREVINAVDTDNTHVYSWHTNTTSYDHYRKGKLLYVRK